MAADKEGKLAAAAKAAAESPALHKEQDTKAAAEKAAAEKEAA